MESRPKPIRWLDRFSIPLELISTIVGLLFLWYFTDISAVAIGGAGIGMGLASLWQPIKRRYGINSGWGKLPLGLGVLTFGAYSFTDASGEVVVKAGFLIAGGWLTLDALYDLTTGTGATTTGALSPMEQFGDAAIVGQTLDNEPRSIDELDATLDLSRSRIENGLGFLQRSNTIVEQEGRYHARLQNRSLSQALRDAPSRSTGLVSRLSDRLIRPLRLFL